MYKRKLPSNYYLADTQVENIFISEYLPGAPESCAKVYLYALMCACSGCSISDEELAAQLSLGLQAVLDAWEYWENLGIVERLPEGIQFVNQKELVFDRSAKPAKKFDFDLDDKVLSELYAKVEQICSRTLEAKEMTEIVNWLSVYHFSPEIIAFCYEYCTNQCKSNKYSYVGAVLKEWKSKELSDVEAIKEHLATHSKNGVTFKLIFKELGFKGRYPTVEEERIMSVWLDKWKCTVDEIKDACKQTANTSKPSINYVNSVLASRKGVDANGEASGEKPSLASLYAKIREENEAKSAEIRAALFSKYPRLRAITEELRSEAAKLSSAILSGNKALIAQLKEKIASLNSEKAELLAGAGYGENALDPIYNCERCKDTGELPEGGCCPCSVDVLASAKNR